jgi:hypothetical protein
VELYLCGGAARLYTRAASGAASQIDCGVLREAAALVAAGCFLKAGRFVDELHITDALWHAFLRFAKSHAKAFSFGGILPSAADCEVIPAA